jgi:UDP-N-acetylglucosamine 2-epimerase (non-hydrolysing)
MPEETNRVLTDNASDVLFAPSESAVETLEKEGITKGVHLAGDVMYDAILWARDVAREESEILNSLSVRADKFILSTVHRAANTDNRNTLESIIDGLSNAPLPVILPLHPRTEERLEEYGLQEWATDELEVIDPVGYIDFVRLIDDAERVATDSGGVQKEAFYLDTPCVTMREETEWRETTECGWNRLVGSDSAKIRDTLKADDWPESKPNLYGNGQASQRVIEVLELL